MKKINVWYRLYVVAVLVLALGAAMLAWQIMYENALRFGEAWDGDIVRTVALGWLIACAILFVVGQAVAWAIRGARQQPAAAVAAAEPEDVAGTTDVSRVGRCRKCQLIVPADAAVCPHCRATVRTDYRVVAGPRALEVRR